MTETSQYKNILITGGAGFIGSALCLKLVSLGYNVTVLDNLSPQVHGDDGESSTYQKIKDKVTFIKGDICDQALLGNSLKGQDVVIHLAAETGTGQSMYQIQKYTHTNIDGTAVLLEQLLNPENSVKKIILASSRAVYGEGAYECEIHGKVFPHSRDEKAMLQKDFEVKCPICDKNVKNILTPEDALIKPISVYAATKSSQEELVKLSSEVGKFQFTILRFQNVYGPGQSLSNPYTGILSIFSTALRENKKITIFEDGKESRDFVYIDDVVNSIVLVLEKSNAEGKTYNVGSGEKQSVFEVASILKQKYNSTSELLVTGNFRKGDIRHNQADLTRIKSELGFNPQVTFSDGLDLFVKWVLSQEKSLNKYEDSLEELRRLNMLK